MHKALKFLAFLLPLAFFSNSTLGDNAYVTGNVVKLINQDGGNGRCLVKLDASANDKGLSCTNPNFVSLDCEGTTGNDKGAAARNWDIATLAMVTSRTVKLRVYDNITVDGYCYSPRLDIEA